MIRGKRLDRKCMDVSAEEKLQLFLNEIGEENIISVRPIPDENFESGLKTTHPTAYTVIYRQ